jgi:hypothetical protein
MSATIQETTNLHLSLRARVRQTLLVVDGPCIDTDLIFSKIEAALRKNLRLSFAQCDAVLADVRGEIEQVISEKFGGAIDFGEAVEAIEELIDDELGDDGGLEDDTVSTPAPGPRVIK